MTQAKREITLGSDPEVAVVNMLEGAIVPVCGLFGGDKGDPVPVNEHGGWLEDGVALELNPVPRKKPEEAQKSLHALIRAAADFGAKKNISLHYPVQEQTFHDDVLSQNPKASVFGCAQDLSAYYVGVPRENVMQQAMRTHGNGIRFYGGHVHLGITDWPEALPKFVAVRIVDLLLGAAHARAYTPYPATRDEFYGRAGLYRETAYGIEYRTLSNHWIKEDVSKPHTLRRLHDIGKIFANFEEHSSRLVEIYNSVDWAKFEEGFNYRNWDAVQDAARPVLKEAPLTGNMCVPVGGLMFPIFSLRAVLEDKDTGTSSKIYGNRDDLIRAENNIVDAMRNAQAAVQEEEERRAWYAEIDMARITARSFPESRAQMAMLPPATRRRHTAMKTILQREHASIAAAWLQLLDRTALVGAAADEHERRAWLRDAAHVVGPMLKRQFENNWAAIHANVDYERVLRNLVRTFDANVHGERLVVLHDYPNFRQGIIGAPADEQQGEDANG